MTQGDRLDAIADQEEDRRRVISLRSYLAAYPDVSGRYAREIVQLQAAIARREKEWGI